MAESNGTPERRGPESATAPSEPRTSEGPSDVGPGRLQALFALVLILVLVAIPLYLWRRPTSVSDEVARAAPVVDASTTTVEIDGAPAIPAPTPAPVEADAAPPLPLPAGVTLSEAKVLECHDPGPKRTAPSECDHLPGVERALAKVIADNAACVPPTAGAGTVPFTFDVSYQRKRQPVSVSLPREGRTLKNTKAIAACASAVRKALTPAPTLDATHQHARYKIQLVATFGGTTPTP